MPDDFNIEENDEPGSIEAIQQLENDMRRKRYEMVTKMIDDGMDIFVISEQMQLSIHEIDAIILGGGKK